jgi:peptidoglycan-associated lipoprotein
MAESLKANAGTKVQVQGNTDDRGSVEYNYALGTRRAQSLKDFFVAQGVNGNDVSTVSYGKERPVAHGANEAAWAQNRRDDVVVAN